MAPIGFNIWSPVGGAVWVGAETLLEKVRHWQWALRFQSHMSLPDHILFFFLTVQDVSS